VPWPQRFGPSLFTPGQFSCTARASSTTATGCVAAAFRRRARASRRLKSSPFASQAIARRSSAVVSPRSAAWCKYAIASLRPAGARPPASLYVAGPFSMGYVDFFTFLIPLYGLSLGLDVSEIGVLVGARSILALFLSIHIGVLMDRFGTRAVTLVFVWTGMALAPLFPLATGFWALLFLQLVNGAAVSFAWSGAQTLIAQLTEGDARYIGRFSFFARLGSTSAPIVAGAVWDFGGAWPAYLLGAAWGAVLTTALLRTPEGEFFTPQPASGTNQNRFRARDVWPRTSDYVSAIKLIAIPAVPVSMAVISMRNTRYSLQTSVYIVYLDRIALVGTTIGTLFAAAADRLAVIICCRARLPIRLHSPNGALIAVLPSAAGAAMTRAYAQLQPPTRAFGDHILELRDGAPFDKHNLMLRCIRSF
jgi:MFS family permease